MRYVIVRTTEKGHSMRRWTHVVPTVLLFTMCLVGAAAAQSDTSPHVAQLVAVEQDLQIEVLDWGGSGPPILFLAGLGNTAHSFDEFALRLRDDYHVYALTRRGFGASSHPNAEYGSDVRTQDIRAVLDTLRIEQIFLLGHSIAGDELSRFAVLHPERVRALIYIEAYSYGEDAPRLQARNVPLPTLAIPPMTAADSLSAENVAAYRGRLVGIRLPLSEILALASFSPDGRLQRFHPSSWEAVNEGTMESEFGRIDAPVLGIFGTERRSQDDIPYYAALDSENQRLADAFAEALAAAQLEYITRFRSELRDSRVVEILGGHHYVHFSHPQAVESAIREFLREVLVP